MNTWYGKIRLLCVLAACWISFSGCQKNEEKKASITINYGSDIPSLAPWMAASLPSYTLIYNLGDGITRVNEHDELVPALAETITPSEDGLKYHIVLREKAIWSSGIAITSSDFLRSYLQILTKKVMSPTADMLFSIKNAQAIYQDQAEPSALGFTIINDREFELELEAASPIFMYQMSMPVYFPIPEGYNAEKPLQISCGAYYVKSWEHGKQLVLEKNPHYWDHEHIKIESITFTMVPDEQTQYEMFQAGDLDWCGVPFVAIPTEAEKELKEKGQFQLLPEPSVYMPVFHAKEGPFANLKLRRAFSLGINRAELIKHGIFNGRTAVSFVSPSISGYEELFFPIYDENQAKANFEEALEEMGLTRDQLPPLRMLYPSRAQQGSRRAAAIQADWYRLFGVRVEIVSLEWKTYLEKMSQGEFEIGMASWVGDYPDASNFLQLYRYVDSSRNFPRWENADYQHHIELGMNTLDPLVKKDHYKAAERILLDQMIVAPISFPSNPYLCSPRLKGVYCTNMGVVDFHRAYIEE